MNMVRAIISLLVFLSPAISIETKPAVDKADAVCNIISKKGTNSINDRIMVTPINIKRLIKTIVNALAAVAWEIRLPNAVISFWPLITVMAMSITRLKVVVLIPPPVEEGDAPTNINRIIINLEALVKPAVNSIETCCSGINRMKQCSQDFFS
jgi:hypothetical protein